MMDPLFHRYFKNPEGGLIISLLLLVYAIYHYRRIDHYRTSKFS